MDVALYGAEYVYSIALHNLHKQAFETKWNLLQNGNIIKKLTADATAAT
jgi:hypothetical protein